jgi:hypothetical protein
MDETMRAAALHPRKDGFVGEERFLRLFIDAFWAAAAGRRRADLREVQTELLDRGWRT